MTSKLQVTLPKAAAEQLGIQPGDEIDWEVAGEALRVIPAAKMRRVKGGTQARVGLFDQATRRLKKRESMVDPALTQDCSIRDWVGRRGNDNAAVIAGPCTASHNRSNRFEAGVSKT